MLSSIDCLASLAFWRFPLFSFRQSHTINRKSNPPRFADGLRTQAVSLRIVDELVLRRIELHRAIERDRDVCRMARDVRIASCVGVALRLAPRLHAIEKIAH